MNAVIANNAIPSPSGKKSFINKNFDTADIMKLVLNCYKQHNSQLSSFSNSLRGNTTEETCYNVWKFIKDHIRYQVDKGGDQYVQTPAALWQSKVGDCKSFAVFAASILHNLGIDGVIRFVSYDVKDKIPKHVYVVVNGIVIDPTPYGKTVYWNTEFNPKHIYDYSMSELAMISGIRRGSKPQRRIAGSGMYSIGCPGTFQLDNGMYFNPCTGTKTTEPPVKTTAPPITPPAPPVDENGNPYTNTGNGSGGGTTNLSLGGKKIPWWLIAVGVYGGYRFLKSKK